MHPLPQGYHVYKLSTIYLARSKNSFMRIKNAYRWKAFERENEEIRLHRKKERLRIVRKNVTLLANGFLNAIQMEKHFHKFYLAQLSHP